MILSPGKRKLAIGWTAIIMARRDLKNTINSGIVNVTVLLFFSTLGYIAYLFRSHIVHFLMILCFVLPIRDFTTQVEEVLSSADTITHVLQLSKRPKIFLPLGSFLFICQDAGGLLASTTLALILLPCLLLHKHIGRNMLTLLFVLASVFFFALIGLKATKETSCMALEGIQLTTSIDLPYILGTIFGYVDERVNSLVGFDILDGAEGMLKSLSILKNEEILAASKLERATQLIDSIATSLDWALVERLFRMVDTANLLQLGRTGASLVATVFDKVWNGMDYALNIMTFLLTVLFLLLSRSSDPVMSKEYPTFKFLSPYLLKLLIALKSAIIDIVSIGCSRPVVEIAITYCTVRLCGSSYPACYALLAALLSIFPIVHPSLSLILACFELYTKYGTALVVLIPIGHGFLDLSLVPRQKIPPMPNSNRLADISSMVGLSTFGPLGLILGPIMLTFPVLIANILSEIYE